MIKKISCTQLQPGMYIHDLNCGWMAHPFVRRRFLLTDPATLAQIRNCGVKELYIDIAKGLDLPDAPTTEAQARTVLEREMKAIAAERPAVKMRACVEQEIDQATRVYDRAGRVVRAVMRDVRLGKAIESSEVEAVVEDIIASVDRNSGALLSLLRLERADDYTFLHSVAVGTLMVTFARALGFDGEMVRQAGIGGLLHDVGKIKIPAAVLNKPGKLTDNEFAIIKRHPTEGHAILLETQTIGAVPLEITLHHHERIDGCGYPDGLVAEKIGTLAKMAAIADVYDAITSNRCYRTGMPPTDALRKLLEWSKFHLDGELVQRFMRTIGIYPVGTLVRLESGRLAVVAEQSEGNLLAPKVKAFFSTKSGCYIPVVTVDLARLSSTEADCIASHEDPKKWNVDPGRFL
jgi:putative nucleotidyltransferase with HDIG domain